MRGRAHPLTLAMLGPGLGLLGCRGPQRALDVHGPGAAELAKLWWVFLSATAVPAALTIGILLWAVWRGSRRGAPTEHTPARDNRIILICGGVVVAIVLGLLLLSFRTARAAFVPPSEPDLTIDVVGHQFWWEVRYPDHQVVTANELHLPVGQTARLRLTTADVIHSFWVPQLHGKKDMIPGRVNSWWLRADRPGVYRGQCAEFCGIQHALMAMLVIAEEPEQFDAWVEQRRRPARPPEEPLARRGQEVFRAAGCPLCHVVQGVFPEGAAGMVGPDLTHLASRRTFAAATAPITVENLEAWIRDPHVLKPGVRMPPLDIPDADLTALVAYLMSLH